MSDMNKTTWLCILITAESCSTEKQTWTVEDVRKRANHDVSTKTVRTAFGHLESMNLIRHQKNSTEYEFIEPDF